MSGFTTYNELIQPTTMLSRKAEFPFHDYFRANPLNQNVAIYPRRAGYMPYNITTVKEIQPDENSKDDIYVYQSCCSIIVPSSKSYRETHQIITQP